MSLIKFESSVKLDAERKERRETRENILAKAKSDYERREAREEKRKKSEQWMLPSVSERLQPKTSKDDKHKSGKKKKHHRKVDVASGSSDSDASARSDQDDSDQGKWVEKQVEPVGSALETSNLARDSWMTLPSNFVSTLSKEEMKRGNESSVQRQAARDAEKQKRIELEKPGQHARELNPYWKDGGAGLPTAPNPTQPSTLRESSSSSSTSSAVQPSSGQVGDGGLHVLLRAYRRAEEQARDEERPLEDVVAERWGSLDNLEEMIAEKRRLSGQSSPDRFHSRSDHRHRQQPHQASRNRSSAGRSGSPTDFPPRYHGRSRGQLPAAASTKCAFLQPTMDDEDCQSSTTGNTSQSQSAVRSTGATSGWRKPRPADLDKPQLDLKPDTSSSKRDTDDQSQSDMASTSAMETRDWRFQRPQQKIPAPIEPEAAPSVAVSPPSCPLSDKELNVLGSKIVKAELMGNNDLANRLRAQLDAARQLREAADASGAAAAPKKNDGEDGRERVVVLTRTDARGMTRPLPEAEFPVGGATGGRRKKLKAQTHDTTGQRNKYFADDDRYSLKQMFEREKLGTAEDHNKMFVRLAGQGLDPTNEDYDVDDVFVGRANRCIDDSKIEAQERLAAIGELNRSSAAMDNCRFCFDGKDSPKHLIIAIGLKVYVTLPAQQSLTDGHCLIVPMQHVAGSTYLDEDVWSEVQIFRKGLTKMFESQQRDVVFFESMMHLKRFPHMTLQCVPLPSEEGSLAPMYFKKAILESETEWAMNKKLVDLSQKDIRKAIPKGLPYFSVDFGLQGGFGHVIEDEQAFPKNFAQEIVGGMLDLDANVWRRPAKENFETQRKKVLEFAEWWKPYDWTQRLKETE